MALPSPSTPKLASYSDSDPKGDNSTVYNNPALTGTAEPGSSIVLYDGFPGVSISGAGVTSTGDWTARTVPLRTGVHQIYAIAVDNNGLNQSPPSQPLVLTILGAVASKPGAPTIAPLTAPIHILITSPVSNGGSSITGYKIYRGTQSGTETLISTASPSGEFIDITAQYGTRYYYRVSAINAIGEGPLSNERF